MKVDNVIKDEPVYFINLAKNNELPKWITKWKNGLIKISPKEIEKTVNIITPKNTCIVHICKYKDILVGSDETYHYFLTEINFTASVMTDGIFMINIMLEAKNKIKKNGKNNSIRITKKVNPLSYEIYCPILQ